MLQEVFGDAAATWPVQGLIRHFRPELERRIKERAEREYFLLYLVVDACKSIHAYVVRRSMFGSVLNSLIDMYSECGEVNVARQILIMQKLKARGINNEHTLAYQSRVGPVQWLKPYTDEVLVELGQKGVKSLLAIPVSFVSKHIETLEEIDMEYKHLALESGIKNWGRVPALVTNETSWIPCIMWCGGFTF